MKNLSSIALLLFFAIIACAQAPQSIPYQAVARDSTGSPLPNTSFNIRLSIYNGSPTGTLLYQETDSVVSTNLGLFNINIGTGIVISGAFSSINWADDSAKYLKVEASMGGSGFINMGASQLLSVPFALYAGQSGSSASETGTATQVPYFNRSGVLHSDSLFTRNDSTHFTAILRTDTGKVTEGFTLGPALGGTIPDAALIYRIDSSAGMQDFVGAGNFSGLGYIGSAGLVSRSINSNGPAGDIIINADSSFAQILISVKNPGLSDNISMNNLSPGFVASGIFKNDTFVSGLLIDTGHVTSGIFKKGAFVSGLAIDTAQSFICKAGLLQSPPSAVFEAVYAGGPSWLIGDGAGAARIDLSDSALHFDFVGSGLFSNLRSPLLSDGSGMVHLRLSAYDSTTGINPALIASVAAMVINEGDTTGPAISMVCSDNTNYSLGFESFNSTSIQIMKLHNRVVEGLAIGQNQYANMGDGAYLIRYDSTANHADVIGEFYTSLFSNPDTSHTIGLLCQDFNTNAEAAFLLADSDPVNPQALIITGNGGPWGSLAQFTGITAGMVVQGGAYSSVNGIFADTNGLHLLVNNKHWNWPGTDGAAGETLATDGSGNLNWQSNSGSGAVFTPATGDTIAAIVGSNIVNPSAGLSSLIIELPASPADNQTAYFTFTSNITALSFTGGTVVGPLPGVSSVANGNVKYWLTYKAGSGAWF